MDVLCKRLSFNERVVPLGISSVAIDRDRLAKMGITTDEQLRMACRELVDHLAEKEKADAATELERKLIGSKVGFDFFQRLLI